MWFKVDDQLAFHRKTLKAGNAAMGLWVRAGSWLSGQKREDAPGVITLAELRTMGTAAEVNRLEAAGFFTKAVLDREKAYRFNDWHEYQPLPEEIAARRSDWAARKARQRRHRSGDHDDCLPRYCDHAPPEPHREDETG